MQRHIHMYLVFVCVWCGCPPPPPPWAACPRAAESTEAEQFPVPALGCCGPAQVPAGGAKMCGSAPLELYKMSVSTRSKARVKCTDAYGVFSSKWLFFFSISSPILSKLPPPPLPLVLAEPISPFATTASRRESVALVGFGNLGARFLSHCFPLSQSSRGVFLTAAFVAGLLRHAWTAPTSQINRTLCLLMNSVLWPVRGIFQSRAIVAFPLMCKAEPGVWAASFCSQEPGR